MAFLGLARKQQDRRNDVRGTPLGQLRLRLWPWSHHPHPLAYSKSLKQMKD